MMRRRETTVRKIGGSYGVLLPIEVLRAHGATRGDTFEISHGEVGTIILSKVNVIT